MSEARRRQRFGGPGRRAAVALVLGLIALQLSACADYRPYRAPDSSEIPEGPGLFTGSQGEWTLFRMQKEADQEESGEDTVETAK